MSARRWKGIDYRPTRPTAIVAGEGIRDIFMVPYNFKVWTYPVERLWAGWISERVAVSMIRP